jgi:hypothetical protein
MSSSSNGKDNAHSNNTFSKGHDNSKHGKYRESPSPTPSTKRWMAEEDFDKMQSAAEEGEGVESSANKKDKGEEQDEGEVKEKRKEG